MKTLLISAVVLVGLAGAAAAAPIVGDISIIGDDTFTPASVTFLGTSSIGDTSGDFSELPNCFGCVTTAPDLTAASTGVLFTATSGGNTVSLTLEGVPDFVFTPDADPALDALLGHRRDHQTPGCAPAPVTKDRSRSATAGCARPSPPTPAGS